jgi:hypothetical protein
MFPMTYSYSNKTHDKVKDVCYLNSIKSYLELQFELSFYHFFIYPKYAFEMPLNLDNHFYVMLRWFNKLSPSVALFKSMYSFRV